MGKSGISTEASPPDWIEPQLTRLVDDAPDGPDWLHEIKLDGYRIHARIDGTDIRLLTRTGLDWTGRYQATASALRGLKVRSAYIDGELCAARSDGVTSFSRLQAAMDEGRTGDLVFFAFDLLFLDGENTANLPILERKARLAALFLTIQPRLRFSDHIIGDGPRFRAHVCGLKAEGAVSKRIDRAYAPGDRGIWVKSKCLNREEFVVVGWTDPTGSRAHIGSLLLGYYTEDGSLLYAGRVGTGMTIAELSRLSGRLSPLGVSGMPLSASPPRESRFGSPLELSRVHWVRPQLVVEVTYLTWTEGGLLRQVSYQGLRQDKPARQVVRTTPSP